MFQVRYARGRLLLTILAIMTLLIAALGAVMAWQAWQLAARQEPVSPRPGVTVDAEAAARRLGVALSLPTIWSPDGAHDAAFLALHRHLQASFPAAHAAMTRQVVGRHALLYTWAGSDPKAMPVALLAHQDVVPVAPGTEDRWTHPPFSGAVVDGFVWGRGAWDNKSSVMGLMEAVEVLARSGFKPRQTLYLALGADEEVGGKEGAVAMAALLRQQGVKLRFVLDEGLVITHGMVPGVSKPVALIGMAEKGFMTLKLTAVAQPGHSSMPPPRSAIGVLGEAVARVEAQPMPARLQGLPRQMFEAVAPEMDTVMRGLMSNIWLTEPLLLRQLEKIPSTNAMVRTTGVATVFQAGERENVMVGQASALINFRLLPGDRSEAVIDHVRRVVAGLDVRVERQPWVNEASPVSSAQTSAYRLLSRSLRELQPDVVVAPGLLVGATDSRHYADLTESIFRFAPMHAAQADLAMFHGTNERISVRNYAQMIQFYERLMRESHATSP
ncbi:MAG TPA: M20 family peptidase [Aquabacterium sp.]|uniref:M20 family peptidase n=1 Tax=Aquabacterium sp. TaxID=1872578 RepID=UPI002E32A824|nr:M20 family peptidase [Aquabacterium sp.]HEX5372633.1 M20 family peptidase [Aquabacterium sp.]